MTHARAAGRLPLLGALALAGLIGLGGCRRTAATADPAVEAGDTAIDAAPGLIARLISAMGFGGDSDVPPYTGHDARGIPHYAQRTFTDEERAVLRNAFGVEDPNRLYVSDSTEGGLLDYDTQFKRCLTCYVNSYTVGFVSIRKTGESWDQLERRVHAMRRTDFPPWALVESTSLDELYPGGPATDRADAGGCSRRWIPPPGHRDLSVVRARGVPLLQGGNRTHTLTSMHSYGRAIDVVVDDGNLRNRATHAAWIAFRRWVTRYDSGAFHILGRPDASWDWPHVEVPSDDIGFRSIDEALAVGRRCLSAATARSAQPPCEFPSHATPAMSSKQ